MAPRSRLPDNKALPKRWTKKHGAYYYLVPTGFEHLWDGKKWFRLGVTLAEAHREFAKHIEPPVKVTTIADLLERYEREVVPNKAPKTATENVKHIATLRVAFGPNLITDIEPQHIYLYVANRKSKKPGRGDGKTAAKREIEVLSHAFTKAVEWGLLKKHPFKGEVRLEGSGEGVRTRYVEDWELVEVLKIKPLRKRGGAAVVQALLRLKILTGLRQRDLLQICMSDLQEDGLHILISKTKKNVGKRVIYTWTEALRAEIDRALAVRPNATSEWLFCNRMGESYVSEDGTASSWNSLWQNFMERVLRETKVTERFTEHDMRAKVGSDAEDLARAQQLLGHVDARTTKKIYRRKAERVEPTR